MRACTVGYLCALALLALPAGCGSAGPERKVRLKLTAPADLQLVREDRVRLTGTVRPARAGVSVLGRPATVRDGRFEAEVALTPGINLVDVMASAADRRSDFATVRVNYERGVTVPELVGATVDDARAQLEQLELSVDERQVGGLLDGLSDGDPTVCATDPAAGTRLEPDAVVTLEVAREC